MTSLLLESSSEVVEQTELAVPADRFGAQQGGAGFWKESKHCPGSRKWNAAAAFGDEAKVRVTVSLPYC
ncbi:unnamed protein product [Soboliphyme baturini]|uniref:Uncharacterized protein n=1 Tax=Soboliphyme baturini TaxID=241478 RepID=A0A183I9D9_9BILA|nr:unnamed protein product [Soboliphyme baturini]